MNESASSVPDQRQGGSDAPEAWGGDNRNRADTAQPGPQAGPPRRDGTDDADDADGQDDEYEPA